MTVLIGSWEFEGPFISPRDLKNEPGLYAVLAGKGNNVELVTLDESRSVRTAVQDLLEMTPGTMPFTTAVYYCSDLTTSLRQGLIDEVLKEFDIQDDFEDSVRIPTHHIEHTALLSAINA